jgi:hypothetical protein
VHVVAGFASQIAAHGGALAITESARERGLDVQGAALARLDTQRSLHVSPVPGFAMPRHVLQLLDGVFVDEEGPAHLRIGETGLVVALDGSEEGSAAVPDLGALRDRGALWVLTMPQPSSQGMV